jgi:hypothetical protein
MGVPATVAFPHGTQPPVRVHWESGLDGRAFAGERAARESGSVCRASSPAVGEKVKVVPSTWCARAEMSLLLTFFQAVE